LCDPSGEHIVDLRSDVQGKKERAMIQRWLSEIEAILRDARAVLDGLTPEQANKQPQPGHWSVAQNIAHVTKTTLPYLECIETALKEPSRNGPIRPGILAALLEAVMEPPPRMRVKTFSRLEPPEKVDVGTALAEFDAAHQRLAEILRTAEEGDFLRTRFRSPYMSMIRLRMDQGVRVILAHSRRHLWQSRQVRRALGVPG
jgi:hypothetical protein